jgi:predicted phage terminase large subunit-like protein
MNHGEQNNGVTHAGKGAGAGDILTFWEFFSECFVPLNKLALPLKPAHKIVCDALQDAVYGFLGKQFVVINIPPRIGKTKILEALACWQIANFGDSQIILTSYSADLAETSLRYVRKVLGEQWYIELFGAQVGTICKADLVNTRDGGNIYAAGNGGTLTGKGGGLKRRAGGFISIDDPAKPTEALSPIEAENVRQWFELTLKSRRNSDVYCPIIICAQRLALDDLCGYVLETYPNDTHHIKIEAMGFDKETSEEISNFPETYSLANLRASRDSDQSNIRFGYWSQMQQEPIARGGNLIPVDKFNRYECAGATTSIKFDRRIITCDTALKTKEHNDYSVLQIWGRSNNRAYLIDQIRGKWESPDLLKNALAFWRKHTSHAVGPTGERLPFPRFVVEEKAAGTGLIQQMRRDCVPVEGCERNIDKVTRVNEILPFIETGMVYIPRDTDAPWVPGLVTECAQFRADGKSKHDDQTDCLADAILLLLGKPLSIFDVIGKPKR